MAIQTRTANADLDAWFASVTSLGAAGNGSGDRMGVGQSSPDANTWTNRLGVRIPLGSKTTVGSLFYGIANSGAITSFKVFLRIRTSGCGGLGGAVRFFLEPLDSGQSFIETSYGTSCGVSTSGGAGGRWPGPVPSATTNRGGYSGAPNAGDWISVDLTAAAKAAYDAGTTSLWLRGIAGNAGLTAYDEANTARRAEFYTRESASQPYGQVQWSDNSAPTIPTNLTPAGGTVQGSTNGASFTVSAQHNDPEGDTATKYQAQWFPAGTTDAQADAGSVPPTIDTGGLSGTTSNGSSRSYTFTGLPVRTAGEWRFRFYDGQWGPFSLLQAGSTAYKPTAVNLAVEAGTLTPHLYASISSSDSGDYITSVREIVYYDPVGGSTITMMDSGKQSIGGTSTRSAYVYSGAALSYGITYRREMQLWNRDDVASDLTADTTFTPAAAVGANISYAGNALDTSFKIDTLTPTFRVADPSAGNIDQCRLRLYNESGIMAYDSGTLSFTAAAFHDVVVPASVLGWGNNWTADASDRLSGNANLGPYCPQKPFHINAIPGSPYPVTVAPAVGGQVVQRADGTWVTTDPTAFITYPFRDTDRTLGYSTEFPTLRDHECRSLAAALIAKVVRTLYALDGYVETTSGMEVLGFEQPASLNPTSAGWVAGSTCALTYDAAIVALGHTSLKLAFTNLPTATTSTSTLTDGLHSGTLYTDLSGIATCTLRTYRSAGPAGLAVKLRFYFSGVTTNFAEFAATPTANGAWQQFTLTLASPAASGGTVNWTQVSGVAILVSHTAGSNQTFNINVDDLRAVVATIETTTQRRARYADSAAQLSDYSAYALWKYSAAPTLSAITPADLATITDPSPPFGWTFASAGGKTQAFYQVTVNLGQATIYDTGLVAGTVGVYGLPAFVLDTGQVYQWTLSVYDTDGLMTSVTRSFTTSFTQPPALTGLVLTPDPDAKAIDVAWNASGLTTAEFEAYYVYAKSGSGQFAQVATITDKTDTTYTLIRAAHNVETIVRVTQTNGWKESDPLEGSAVLGGPPGDPAFIPGYWLIDSTGAVLAVQWTTHGPGDTQVQLEQLIGLGRADKVVLTWGVTGYEATFSLFSNDRALLAALRAYKDTGSPVLYKTHYGAVRYIRLTKAEDSDRPAGYFAATVGYMEIDPAVAGF